MTLRAISTLVIAIITAAPAIAQDLPAEITPDAVKRVKQATVYLKVTDGKGKVGEGSGFLVLEPGLVATNSHVLGMLSATAKPPKTIDVTLRSGEAGEVQVQGKFLSHDRHADIALVRIEGKDLPEPLKLWTKDDLYETQKVYIFGFPFGAQLGKNITVSVSSISSLRRSGGALDSIQTNGGMQPGNSGGPVVDSLGRVVGVSVAIIKSTQINFAVPAIKVESLLSGRIQERIVGEAFHDGDQIKLSAKYRLLDPLRRIRDVRVELWPGNPADPKAPAAKSEPPDDKSRRVIEAKTENGVASADIVLPKLDAGKVAWIRPVLIFDKGERIPGEAQSIDPAMALRREPAKLVANFTDQKERTTSIKSRQSLQFAKGNSKLTGADIVDVDILETLSPSEKQISVKTGFGLPKVVFENGDKKSNAAADVIDTLQKIPPTFIVDETNKLRSRVDINLSPRLPGLLREQVNNCYLQICNAYEAANIILPNKEINPLETWDAKVPLLLKLSGKPEVVDLAIKCTYEGMRSNGEALVSVAGRALNRNRPNDEMESRVLGKFTFDTKRGFVSTAKISLSSEFSPPEGDLQVSSAFEVDLSRREGNPLNIQAPKSLPSAPKQEVIAQVKSALGPRDLQDVAFAQKGSRMKVLQVPMIEGKAYTILMNSDAFDCYLRLVDPKGKVLAEDDDSGGGLNSRIDFIAPSSGQYRIIMTSFDGQMGPFTLQVLGEGNVRFEGLKKSLLDRNDNLTEDDPADEQFGQRGSRKKVVPFQMTEGKRYTITLKSDEFDAYLRLIDPKGKVIVEDDDGGGGLNSRIDYKATVTGEFKLVATSLDGKRGAFQLQVLGEDDKGDVKKDVNSPPRKEPEKTEPEKKEADMEEKKQSKDQARMSAGGVEAPTDSPVFFLEKLTPVWIDVCTFQGNRRSIDSIPL